MRRAAAVTLIATGAVLAVTLSAGNEPRPKRPPTAAQVVRFINHQRVPRNLPGLKRSERLSRAARRWSAHLAATSSFVHASAIRPPGFRWGAETLYLGTGGPTRSWLNSPPHRAILLSPRARLIGMARSGDTWVGRFGAR